MDAKATELAAVSAADSACLRWAFVQTINGVSGIVHVVVLASMAAQAAVACDVRRDHASGLGAVGGLFLIESDSMRAIDVSRAVR